jgi:glucosamine--fructose-6-phosphate aminotransferase (isomerizing)
MKYKMYDEMMEQPDSLQRTFESELPKMDEVSQLVMDADKVYLVGCGSSISTCYSVRDAIRMSSTNIDIEVYAGYEFCYNKKLIENENSIAIFTSQSGETADTLAALRKANEYGLHTVFYFKRT